MDRNQIFGRLRAMLADSLAAPEQTITMQSRLIDDLGADSLDFVDLVFAIDTTGSMAPYIAAVQDLAREFGAACVVPLHEAFNQARAHRPDIEWTLDGVHPTSTGHALIARKWLEATGTL